MPSNTHIATTTALETNIGSNALIQNTSGGRSDSLDHSAASPTDVDLERTHTHSTRTSAADPYNLRRGFREYSDKSSSDSRTWLQGILGYVKQNFLATKQLRAVETYHKKQNDLIDMLLKPMDAMVEEARQNDEKHAVAVKIAIWASFLTNIVLGAVQVYAAASSKSLAFLATAIDSVFDPVSNGVLWICHRQSARLDKNKWPVGGSRLETIGNITFGSLMSALNLVVIVEAIRTCVSHKPDDPETNEFFLPATISVAAALGTKLILALYCFTLRNESSQVKMLFQDHRNDLWVNGFGIIMASGGSKIKWYIDPIGGILIAFGVICAWIRTIYKEFELLAGRSAPHDFLQLIIYKALTFSDEIKGLDTVRAYHSGPDFFVEVDVVMDGDTPLWRAHDIGQHLQDKLERLPGVNRAFVHIDHETTHRPEHGKYE